MKAYWILTAIGPDRPGLVDQMAEFLADRGINIESSRMAVLGGEFAFMVLISGDSAVLESLPHDLPGLVFSWKIWGLTWDFRRGMLRLRLGEIKVAVFAHQSAP